MTRVFEHARIWELSQANLDTAVRLIANAAAAGGPVEAVVGVAQGGLLPARRVADLLGVPMFQVRARHNATGEAFLQATGNVECHSDDIPAGALHGRVLIVDDICGTGATLHAVIAALAPAAAEGAVMVTATLCRNTGAAERPDIHIWDVEDWVRFPWEAAPDAEVPREQLPAPEEVA